MQLSCAAVAGWEAGRFESTDSLELLDQSVASMEHAEATVSVVDQADIAAGEPPSEPKGFLSAIFQ